MDVQNLGAAQVRNVLQRLKCAELKAAVEQLQSEWATVLATETAAATKKIQKQEKAEEKLAMVLKGRAKLYPKNSTGHTVFLPVGTQVLSRCSAEDAKDADNFKIGQKVQALYKDNKRTWFEAQIFKSVLCTDFL
jgi:hypothetical protein